MRSTVPSTGSNAHRREMRAPGEAGTAMPQAGRVHTVACGVRRVHAQGAALRSEGEQASGEQLPEAAERQEEGGGLGSRRQRDRFTANEPTAMATIIASMSGGRAAEEKEQQGPDQVVLLLDAERPQVQQRLELGRRIEVARLAPQSDVRRRSPHRRRRACPAGGTRREAGSNQPMREARGEHQDERRKDAPHAPPVELGEAEAALAQTRRG